MSCPLPACVPRVCVLQDDKAAAAAAASAALDGGGAAPSGSASMSPSSRRLMDVLERCGAMCSVRPRGFFATKHLESDLAKLLKVRREWEREGKGRVLRGGREGTRPLASREVLGEVAGAPAHAVAGERSHRAVCAWRVAARVRFRRAVRWSSTKSSWSGRCGREPVCI